MRDLDIRRALRGEIALLYQDDPDTLVVEELGLCEGDARIDVAVINGSITGYEIKSERDTLDRLPSQMHIYSRCLTYVTVVATELHLAQIHAVVPRWWGSYGHRSTATVFG